MKKLVKKILKNRGYQLKRYPDFELLKRMKIIESNNINTIFDVGANIGQYARKLRELGYKKEIISFEPLKDAFEELKMASINDNNWIVNNYALGNEDAVCMINIAGNSFSSSILNMLPTHLKSAPESKYIRKEKIEVKKIDSIFNFFVKKEDSVMLKIDTQGFEKNVLYGANGSLKNIKIIQLEMSIIPLYENEMLFVEMYNYLDNKGFQLFALEEEFSNPTTGQLLQVNGMFVKKNSKI